MEELLRTDPIPYPLLPGTIYQLLPIIPSLDDGFYFFVISSKDYFKAVGGRSVSLTTLLNSLATMTNAWSLLVICGSFTATGQFHLLRGTSWHKKGTRTPEEMCNALRNSHSIGQCKVSSSIREMFAFLPGSPERSMGMGGNKHPSMGKR